MEKNRTTISSKCSDDTLIAIPIFNEAGFVDDILSAVHQYAVNILVVDDGSNDGTGYLLKKYGFINVICHQINKGYGQSLIDAFDFGQTNGFEWIITMDCDHQHQPSRILHFLKEIEKNDADIISGSRYLYMENLGSAKPPPERVAINRQITYLLNNILGINLSDSFCGFKAYRVKSLNRLNLTEKGYGLPLQLWIQAVRANLRIREIPVPLIYHDPKRNFAGTLEIPKFRKEYYMSIIQRELALNDCKNTAKISCSEREKFDICES